MTDHLDLPAGIHRIEAGPYHADILRAEPTLSSTLARKLLGRSPLHAWTAHPRLNPAAEGEETDALRLGRAAHCAILGVGEPWAVCPPDLLAKNGSMSTAAAKAWKSEQEAAGMTVLSAAEEKAVLALVDPVHRAIRETRGVPDLRPDRAEMTALAEVDGVWCRAMLDFLPEDTTEPVVDLKTIDDASPENVIRAVERYSLDAQAAFYLDVLEAVEGARRPFLFVFVEKAPPHEVGIIRLFDARGREDEASIEADWMLDARSKVAEARRIWGECLRADRWPGYPRAIQSVGQRPHYSRAWADREIGGPVFRDRKPSAAALRAAHDFQAPI